MSASRRRKIVTTIAVLVLALVGGGAAWWKLRDGPRQAVVAAGDDPWAGTDENATKALIARKRAARGDAPADATPASLSGRVTRKADDSGVAGAVVTVSVREFGGALFATLTGGTSIVVVADGSGVWTAPEVAPGRHVVTAAAAGLLPGSVDVVVAPREARRGVDLALEAGGAEVSGMVGDIGGGAIAGARVTVRPYGLSALDSSAAYVAMTGDDGRYAMTLPDGSWHAKVTQEDYTDGDRAFELRHQPLTLDFSLTPGGVIRGQVIARDTGKPVAGTRVTVSGGHGKDDDDDFGGLGGVATDDDGKFVLRGLASGALSLRAAGRGYATAEPTGVDLAIGEELTGVKVMVDRAYTISGFVVRDGTAGEGVGGVRVGVFSIAKETGMFALHPSAPDGFFEITGVRPASYMIAALGEGVMLEIGKPIAVVDHDVTDVLVTMKTGATLSGKVTPAAVAKLSLEIDPSKIGLGNMFDVAKAALVHGQSDATGGFTVRSAPSGTFKLVAQTADGRTGSIEVTITSADQTGLSVPLEARGSISGRVVDPDGAAVAGVTVEATGIGGGLRLAMGGGASETITAKDGSFRVGGLDPGEIMLSVSDEDGPLAWGDAAHKDAPDASIKQTITAAEDVTGVTLVVEARDGVIRGIVLGSDRTPMADVWISARSTESPWAGRMRAARAEAEQKDGAGGSGSGQVRVEVRTDDDPPSSPGGDSEDTDWMPGRAHTALTGPDGRFTIAHLRRGTYSVVAEPAKGGTRAQKNGVKTGDTVTLVLEKMGSLAGVVTQSGTPVATYDIMCRGPDGDHRRHVTAPDGAYSFDRVPPGKYTCDATSSEGSTSGTVTVASAPTRLDLALAGWGSVTGIIVDAQGKPLAGLKVLAGDEDDMGAAFTELMSGGGPTTDAAGRFEIGHLSGGKAKLIAFSAAGGMNPLVEKDFELVAGQRLDLGTVTASSE